MQRFEFDTETFREWLGSAEERLVEYVRESRSAEPPVIRMQHVECVAESLELSRWIERGGMERDQLDGFLKQYLDASTRLHHPAFASQQVAVPQHPTAIADLVNGATNNGMAIYEMGPSAVAIELTILDWMLNKAGWSALRWPHQRKEDGNYAAGVLTHGGSLANLTALLAARGKIAPDAWTQGVPQDLVLLTSNSCHYSNVRAAAIMGLGENAVQAVPCDELDRIDPTKLAAAIQQVRDSGRRVMALVASACATASGLHDPLREVGQVCSETGVWFHVDGAHGASALVSETERQALDGLELADSFVWDAHKMLSVSALCAAVLFRNESSLGHLFKQQASYLFYGHNEYGVDLIERTIECTKKPLGLKLFLTLAWRGERALGEFIEHQYQLAREFHQIVHERPGFETLVQPQTNIVCFRYRGDDELQVAIKERLIEEGSFHISSAIIGGRRFLRLTLMNPATDHDVMTRMLDRIERLAQNYQPRTSR